MVRTVRNHFSLFFLCPALIKDLMPDSPEKRKEKSDAAIRFPFLIFFST